MAPRPTLRRLAFVSLVLVVLAHPWQGAQGHDTVPGPTYPEAVAAAPFQPIEIALPESALTDSAGRTVDFRREVIADRIVAIDFIYTSCTTVCPILSSIFALVQEELGDHLGRDIHLVSISVDPATDTPARLRAHAEQFGARPGWVFLTGQRPVVNQVLEALQVYTPDFKNHAPVILVGDAGRNVWTRFYGMPSPADIADRLESLLEARTERQQKEARHHAR